MNMPSMEPAGLQNAMRLHELYKIPGANPSDIRRALDHVAAVCRWLMWCNPKERCLS